MTRRTAAIAGWGLVGLTVLLSAPSLVIAATNGPPQVPVAAYLESQASIPLVTVACLVFLSFSSIGALVVSRRPRNGMGWLFTANGPVGALVVLSYTYGYRGLAEDPGSLPFARAAAWSGDITSTVILCLLTVFLFLLFPDGRLRSRVERVTATAAVVGVGLSMLGGVLESNLFDYRYLAAPLAPSIPRPVSRGLQGLGYTVIFATIGVSVALLVGRLRRAVGRERDQLRLLVWAAVVSAVLFSPSFVIPSMFEGFSSTWAFLPAGLAVMLVPASVGVAILRHQMLDIDLVIRRTVVIAVLGAFITVVYVGVVVGVGTVVGSSGNAVLSAIAAAVVALAFQPVRRWAQRGANRLVYGDRATPYEVLHEFSERVAGSYGMEDVLPRMAAILGEGTGARRAQVWLRIGSELRPTVAWPIGMGRSAAVPAVGSCLLDIPEVSHAVAVRDRGELLGALSITKDASDPVSPTEERLVGDLALQAGLVLRNVRLVEDLRASRERLVKAQDQERRRLERDIHDGAQQQLVALQVKQRLAEQLAERDPQKARELLQQLQGETQQALEDLRDLARGIYPPLLADRGLRPALEAQARRAAVPVEVRSDGISRYPQPVEATVYFCCLEALQNATKYANASRIDVSLEATDGELRFEIADDGRGFDPSAVAKGAGLQNMTDRLEAIGGALQIASALGDGTRVLGRIPIGEEAT